MRPKRTPPSTSTGPGALQVAIRLDRAIIDQLDHLAVKLSRPGLAVNRTDAHRVALLKGLDVLARGKDEVRE